MNFSNNPKHTDIQKVIGDAKEAVMCESRALEALSKSIDEQFFKASEILLECSGKIIVSGMGKSGHIGKKIAATFASTGKPSFFMHAAEAGHGDLGMVTNLDCLLLISYTGETKELLPILDYAHRFCVPVIALTGKKTSTLAKLSSVALILPDEPEACPLNLAPTTSTTMTLALGDALAIVILKKKGFTSGDFHTFHPKGSLGHQLQYVRGIMHKTVPLVSPDTRMHESILTMTQQGFGCVGVVESEKLIGIITDGDLRRHMSTDLLQKSSQDVMSKMPLTLFEHHIVSDALCIMNEKNITNMFVVDDENRPIGIVHIHDCL
jgi:arabinose-5-phosphate isomerase